MTDFVTAGVPCPKCGGSMFTYCWDLTDHRVGTGTKAVVVLGRAGRAPEAHAVGNGLLDVYSFIGFTPSGMHYQNHARAPINTALISRQSLLPFASPKGRDHRYLKCVQCSFAPDRGIKK